jgi:hypothetical protein
LKLSSDEEEKDVCKGKMRIILSVSALSQALETQQVTSEIKVAEVQMHLMSTNMQDLGMAPVTQLCYRVMMVSSSVQFRVLTEYFFLYCLP